jgi:hypothetical protein
MHMNYWKWSLAALAAIALPLQAEAKPEKQKKGQNHAAATVMKKSSKPVAVQRGGGGSQTRVVASNPHSRSTAFSTNQRRNAVTRDFSGRQQQRAIVQNQSDSRRTRVSVSNPSNQNRYTRTRYADNSYTRNRYVENRSSYNYERPPYDTYRNWDRGRSYWWNHHHYHWYDGAWVVFDLASPSVAYAPDYGYSSGSVVADVQARLADRGYNPGPIDGVLGSGTRAAIADYQSDAGLPVTARIDGNLLRSLGLG